MSESKLNEVKIIKDQILAILRSGLNSSADVNILAKYCFGISKSYLQSKFNNIYKLEYYEQYTLDEIALDSIVPLFEKRKGDFEFIIIRSFKNWRNPIEDNINADYFVHKIVWNRTANHKSLQGNRSVFC